jgi:hypothetical protein
MIKPAKAGFIDLRLAPLRPIYAAAAAVAVA